MNEPYAETIDGKTLSRSAPGARHELICGRLHQLVHASVANLTSARLLTPRSEVRLSPSTTVRPDLSLITSASGKLWLAAEIVSTDDHKIDTGLKKKTKTEIKQPTLCRLHLGART